MCPNNPFNNSLSYFITEEMKVQLNMFGSSVYNTIGSKDKDTLIVAINDWDSNL